MSVDLEESLLRSGLPLLARFPALPRAVAAVAHRIEEIERCGLSVQHVPLDENEHHGEIRTGQKALSRRERREIARELADTCEIVAEIDATAAEGYFA